MSRRVAAAGLLLAVMAGLHGAAAQETKAEGRDVATMAITGRSVLEAAPDFAAVSIGVTNKAPTTAAAIDATSQAAAKIVAAARAFGIEARDVQTSYVALSPAYRNVRDGSGTLEQRPDGYTASNAVVVRVRQLPRLGDFLRTVVDGGANQIGGVAFELADPTKLEREALAAAIRDARAQAEIAAEAAGVQIMRIESIGTGPRNNRVLRQNAPAPMRAMARAEVPIEAGSLDVSSEVQVVFSIGPKP
jgi:uncharacterized protein YggE